MGCGNPWYDRDGRRLDSPSSFASVGGRELWDVLVAGKAGAWDAAHDDANGNGRADAGEWIDADHNGRADDAWTLVTARPEFQALMKGRAPKRVIGMPQVSSTLQQVRSGDPDADAYAVPLTDTVPTLAEMTTAALNVLDDDPDGLFLMVEGGAVDGAAHLNQSARMIEEECDFEAAVNAAIRWVEEHSSWEQTVLIVTADHETGYLTAAPGAWSYEPLVNNGPRKMPGMAWNSGSHTKSLVPFFAKGPLADAFDAAVIGTDPHRGRYIDNTAIGRTLFAAFGEPIRD
jgi:alkaline phosphatase